MKGLSEKFEKVMTAITFAEAGEHETAREVMRDNDQKTADRPRILKRPRKEYRAAPPRR